MTSETGFVVFFVLGCLIFGGLVSIAMQLQRIAKALEEKINLQSRQTQP